MHGMVINGDKIQINGLKKCSWIKKHNNSELPVEFRNNVCINKNIEYNGGWYLYENDEYILYAFLSDIGTMPHPLIDFSSVSVWYNSNLGGVYVTGKDKNNGAFFAPLVNQNVPS